jgi:hypothetical protein
VRAEQPLERDCEWRRRRRHTWAQRRYVVCINYPIFLRTRGAGTNVLMRARGGLYRSVRGEQLGHGDVYASFVRDLVSSLSTACEQGLNVA